MISNFPYLETLMEDMWEHDPRLRPSATDIVRRMEDVGFLLQHSHLASATNLRVNDHSVAASSSQDSGLFWNVTCAWALKEVCLNFIPKFSLSFLVFSSPVQRESWKRISAEASVFPSDDHID